MQEPQDLRFVVDHEDAVALHGAGLDSAGVGWVPGRRMMMRVPRRRTAGLWATIVPPIASIRPRQIDKPRPVPGLASVGAAAAIELLEDAVEIGRLHAWPLVGDAEDDLVALLASVNDRAAVARIFVRVVQQVEQHLLEQPVVAPHKRQIRREVHPHRLLGESLAAAFD